MVDNIEQGLRLSVEQIEQAEHERVRMFERTLAFFERYDLLLTPATIVLPYPLTQRYVTQCTGTTFANYVEWLAIAYAITLVCCPALCLPCGFSVQGLPVGLQVVAPPKGEARLLAGARFLSRCLPSATRFPSTPEPPRLGPWFVHRGEHYSMSPIELNMTELLPIDELEGALAGRVWRPELQGPSVVAIRPEGVADLSGSFPTMRDLCETPDPAAALRASRGDVLGSLATIAANTPPDRRDPNRPWLLAPIDLQAVKASGVTFAISMLERVIEERAGGDPGAAAVIRKEIGRLVGGDLARLKPGSPEAMALKKVLIAQGAWSQYLEVGIARMPRSFPRRSRCPRSAPDLHVGIHPVSSWNNSEPENRPLWSARAASDRWGHPRQRYQPSGRGGPIGAATWKVQGQQCKSCAVGPFIRFFDPTFTLSDVRQATSSP